MAIQMKATEQYFPVVLFIMPCKVVLTFESVDEILTIQMKAMSSTLPCDCLYTCIAC